jgi:hypothetical protein
VPGNASLSEPTVSRAVRIAQVMFYCNCKVKRKKDLCALLLSCQRINATPSINVSASPVIFIIISSKLRYKDLSRLDHQTNSCFRSRYVHGCTLKVGRYCIVPSYTCGRSTYAVIMCTANFFFTYPLSKRAPKGKKEN